MVTYQVSALMGFTKDHRLHHVKPHGALYNAAAKDLALARAICGGSPKLTTNCPSMAWQAANSWWPPRKSASPLIRRSLPTGATRQMVP